MANVFNVGKKQVMDAGVVTTAQSKRAMLLEATSAFPIAGTHLDYTSITNMLANASWTELVENPSRVDMASLGTTQDDVNDRATAQSQKATFTAVASGGTIVAVVVIHVAAPGTPNDANDEPMTAHDVTDTPTNGGDIEIRWNGTDGTDDFLRLNN